MHLLKLSFLVLTFTLHDVLSQSLFSRFNTSVIPITKDTKTPLFKVAMGYWGGRSNYLMDLDTPFTWKNCVIRVPEIPCAPPECLLPVSCNDAHCIEARSYVDPVCPSLNVTAKYGCRICAVTPMNPVTKSCKISQLTYDFLGLPGTNGKNPSTSTLFLMSFTFSCAPSSLIRSLPKDVIGVAAFSRSALAFPRQLSYLNVVNKFAVCLPSFTSAPGVTFLGDGPFYLLPFPNLDVRSLLSYTPMRNTSKSPGYYVGIKKLSVNGKPIALPLGKSITLKLSTVVPYTTLRSDIYKALVTSFSKTTNTIPRANAVKPFSLCLKTTAVGSGRTGLRVPKIDLEMEGGKKWSIYGGNSMKKTGNSVACLAFIDGGVNVKDAIVMGSFQMEDNFLYMDMVNRRLGFSSSLLASGTSCSNFNFTEIQE